MIPGAKGRKFNEGLLSGEFLNLGAAKRPFDDSIIV